MNVFELRELLEGFDEEAEVRLAHQPSYPLAFTVSSVVDDAVGSDEDPNDNYGPDWDTRSDDDPGDEPGIVWIVEGGHPDGDPYAPSWVFER